MIVDVSHLSKAGFDHVAGIATRPFVATHSSCHALCPHPRNLTDDQLRDVADSGGVVGINSFGGFLSTGVPTLDDYLAHIDHAVRVAGRPQSAGCDFMEDLLEVLDPILGAGLVDPATCRSPECAIPPTSGPSGRGSPTAWVPRSLREWRATTGQNCWDGSCRHRISTAAAGSRTSLVPDPRPRPRPLSVEQLLATGALGDCQVVAGRGGLDRTVSDVYVTARCDLTTPVSPGLLVVLGRHGCSPTPTPSTLRCGPSETARDRVWWLSTRCPRSASRPGGWPTDSAPCWQRHRRTMCLPPRRRPENSCCSPPFTKPR